MALSILNLKKFTYDTRYGRVVSVLLRHAVDFEFESCLCFCHKNKKSQNSLPLLCIKRKVFE